ncbi:hypothetical protein ALC57_07142 [Trachymyrmex cornetzi]|uniref:Uncharacterized protein n=1 Tax=Trachymyrmex cornetzi TaxID=471704 RepID=A0A195E502_9HYME|nr:hypothetical protein ALC57_07142 [Trachymyrmex cornetzi]
MECGPAVLSRFIDGSHVVVADTQTGIAGCIRGRPRAGYRERIVTVHNFPRIGALGDRRKSGGHCVIARGNDASWQRSQQLSFAIEGGKREGGNSG